MSHASLSAFRLIVGPLAACLLAMLSGCQRAGNERFVPASALARDALTASLQAWSSGAEAPRLNEGQPSVQFADSFRAGRGLQAFEIIGELPVQGGRRFEVQLTLSDPPDSLKAQYVVLGIDPLWVIRQEDFDMITHWDHPMPNQAAPSPDPRTDTAGATSDE